MANRRVTILACTECNAQNYVTTRNPPQGGRRDRMELKKYCRYCRRHTVHRETR